MVPSHPTDPDDQVRSSTRLTDLETKLLPYLSRGEELESPFRLRGSFLCTSGKGPVVRSGPTFTVVGPLDDIVERKVGSRHYTLPG